MDHLTSRFRRHKKDKDKENGDKDVEGGVGVGVGVASASADGSLAPPGRTNTVLPSLSITTTPATTPPGSSHSSHSFFHVPRSPLRGLAHQFRSAAHKRARSPVPAQSDDSHIQPHPTQSDNSQQLESYPDLATFQTYLQQNFPLDNAAEPDMNPTKRSLHVGNGQAPRGPKPLMPFFLNQPDSAILAKFSDLVWNERIRYQQADVHPSPNFRFARITDPEAKVLDRYVNIQPWANNRVKLQVPPGKVDYINASPILAQSPAKPGVIPPLRYIAMQGPKVNTVEHVWRMIAEQLESPAVIVMLTETYEGHNEKCYPYFPQDSTDAITIGIDDEFEDGFRGRVECVGIEERCNGAIELRKLRFHIEGRKDMTVWHLLYRKWPDFGVPQKEDWDSFFELMKLSRHLNNDRDGVPRIIHCSAGVGRTGTFIALESLMRDIDRGFMDRIDPRFTDNDSDLVYKMVNGLREQRRQMVQADVQYMFIHKVLRRYWLNRNADPEDGVDGRPAAKRTLSSPGQQHLQQHLGVPLATAQRPGSSPQPAPIRSPHHSTPIRSPSHLTPGRTLRSPRRQPQLPDDGESSDDSAPGGASLY
ncbi:hypothetical protein F5Y16DRAFT_360297 [Xylariaceae sp. FL0255]|nr:hypothetical protein F5Y16DRAFT_360297 [Xylariaceae sp. FL0255]